MAIRNIRTEEDTILRKKSRKVDVIDIVNTIRNKQHEMNFTDAEFAKLLSDLKV